MHLVRRLPLLLVATTSGCLLIGLAVGLVGVVTGAAASLLVPSLASTCDVEGTPLALDSTAYDHRPQEVVDGLGTRSVDMVWYEGDGTRLTMTVSTDATEVTTLTDDGCDGTVLLPVSVSLVTADGRLDEAFEVDARARLDQGRWVLVVDEAIAPDDLVGSLPLPTVEAGEEVTAIGLQLRWGEEELLGGIRGEIRTAGGGERVVAIGLVGGSTQEEIEDKAGQQPDLEQGDDVPVATAP